MTYEVVSPSPIFHLKQKIASNITCPTKLFSVRTEGAIFSLELLTNNIVTNIKALYSVPFPPHLVQTQKPFPKQTAQS
jgi:hypothetical protein